MNLDLYNQKGKKVGSAEVKDTVLVEKINEQVLSQYVYIYLSNQRQGNAQTKDRSEVSGGGKKPWKQKGTGRARVGSNRSPIWRGGGVTFGPRNEVNWKRKTTRSFRAAAFRNALTKVLDGNLVKIVDDLKVEEKKPLTKQGVDIISNFENPKKVTIITSERKDDLKKAFANLQNSKVVAVSRLNVYDLLTGGTILIEEKALEYINSKWAK